MGRLIDADDLIEELKRMMENCVDVGLAVGIKHAILTVGEQPTAYDVEKVVAELEEKMVCGGLNVLVYNQGLSDAIDIVKRGGVE